MVNFSYITKEPLYFKSTIKSFLCNSIAYTGTLFQPVLQALFLQTVTWKEDSPSENPVNKPGKRLWVTLFSPELLMEL